MSSPKEQINPSVVFLFVYLFFFRYLTSKKLKIKINHYALNCLNMNAVSHRRPLDERLHERDLEAAITLSLLNNADGIKDQSPNSKGMFWL